MAEQECEEKWVDGDGHSMVLRFHCLALMEHRGQLPAETLHMNYKTLHAETKLLTALLTAHGFSETPSDSEHFNILWTGVHPKPQVFRSLLPHQRVNHFPRSSELTRKDRLYKNIERMQHTKGVKHFDFVPQSFVMPTEYKEFTSAHYRLKGPWIVKPVASSRGRGIYIVNSPEEVAHEEAVVVGKYVERPLLVLGHKCDLRLYVAVTSYQPLVAYVYEEGLVRFAAVPYSAGPASLANACMHLCNYSINKHHSDYVKSEDAAREDVGHKWTLSALLRHLRAAGADTATLMKRVEESVVKALLATAAPVATACRLFVPHPFNCFEVYGFDLLVDEDLKPWLLEVNLSPSLGCDSLLDTRVKSAMLADLFTLVGIPAVDPNCPPQPTTSGGSRGGWAVRIAAAVRAQYARRGGFVPLFPTPDSWRQYGKFLDPETGLAGFGLDGGRKRNLNLALHRALFGERPQPPDDRLARYESVLARGAVVPLSSPPPVAEEQISCNVSQVDARVLKDQVLECLREGFKLSQIQARLVFAQYLKCALNKLSCSSNKILRRHKIDDNHLELVIKFLQRAASNFRIPRLIKIPNRNLSSKDRMAVIAKQLSDFLYEYTRETDSMDGTVKTSDAVPDKLFNLFLTAAQEGDLEDVLLLSTQLYKSSKLFLGKCYSLKR